LYRNFQQGSQVDAARDVVFIKPAEKSRLIVFDLNGLLCRVDFVSAYKAKAMKSSDYVLPDGPYSEEKPTLLTIQSNVYRLVTPRPGVREFWKEIREFGHTAIWTCTRRTVAMAIVNWLLDLKDGERPPVVLAQDDCSTIRVPGTERFFMHEDRDEPQMFKELGQLTSERGWYQLSFRHFLPSKENTLILDDTPLKCALNDAGNCWFPYS
jgi:NLI interacting factor-like phosphatase